LISASIIAHSRSEEGIDLYTWMLRYPKFIHGEFMTHRKFSRNASSSRAIPTKKLLEEVRSDELRAAPVFWGKNQAGMQAAAELSREYVQDDLCVPYDQAKKDWAAAAHAAADHAQKLADLGAHKQIVNRILEPFLHINVVASATDINNFFGLRLDAAAQPEIRVLAEKMWEAKETSVPRILKPGDWHVPFVDPDEAVDLFRIDPGEWPAIPIKVSVARCARVTHLSFVTGKKSTVEEDLQLYDKLLGSQPIHASPAEHQATPDSFGLVSFDKESSDELNSRYSISMNVEWENLYDHGNFTGWRQFRKMIPGENIAPLPSEYR